MIPSLYIIGGAGTGKSTFTGTLLADKEFGPLMDIHSKRNVKNLVVLRGHDLGDGGLYLGCMRDEFPGTDGLDRATSPCGAEWLDLGMHAGCRYIVSEGATLATRPFLTALARNTDLLVLHLTADDFVKELRFAQRGSEQAQSFVTATATRAENLARDMAKAGVKVWSVDTAEPVEWRQAMNLAFDHLNP